MNCLEQGSARGMASGLWVDHNNMAPSLPNKHCPFPLTKLAYQVNYVLPRRKSIYEFGQGCVSLSNYYSFGYVRLMF